MDTLSTFLDAQPKLKGVHRQKLDLDFSDFLNLARKASLEPGAILLLSGSALDCARFSLLACHPWMTIKAKGHDIQLRTKEQQINIHDNPFAVLKKILKTFKINPEDTTWATDDKTSPGQDKTTLPGPVAGGLFGYLSYDLKNVLEDLPRTCIDDLKLPDLYLCAPGLLVLYDHAQEETSLLIPIHNNNLKQELANWTRLQNRALPKKIPENTTPALTRAWGSNFTQRNYLQAVRKIKEYIVSGHVYQVNLSQRFNLPFTGDGFQTFLDLYSRNPAPFFAYLNCADHQILSTSPERFLQARNKLVETRPIKGTRPRGKTPDQDRNLARELLTSKKDDAELSMIVDLLRNDLGKVCKPGSIQVIEHKRLEKYANVFHLVSLVQGELAEGRDLVDLVTACFPGGSITGCPKIRSMEIIDELEPHSRHIYTGSIGYFGFDNTLDLSIAIRTATIYQGRIYFSVGGGIVFDSDPEAEYEETLHKGQTLTQILTPNAHVSKTTTVWFNGQFMEATEVKLPCQDKGVQYGFGCFETIRVNQGQAMFLDSHLQRLDKSLHALAKVKLPDLSWDKIIERVLIDNKLQDQIAAIKIMALINSQEEPPKRLLPDLLVLPRPYHLNPHPKLRLMTYPWPRSTPLAAHKTLNHLYYILAGNWAKEQGADQALILNPQGTVSETNCANILLVKSKNNLVIQPCSKFVLPGIIQEKTISYLTKANFRAVKKEIYPQELLEADSVLVCNSLLGVKGATSIDDQPIQTNNELEHKINLHLGFSDPDRDQLPPKR